MPERPPEWYSESQFLVTPPKGTDAEHVAITGQAVLGRMGCRSGRGTSSTDGELHRGRGRIAAAVTMQEDRVTTAVPVPFPPSVRCFGMRSPLLMEAMLLPGGVTARRKLTEKRASKMRAGIASPAHRRCAVMKHRCFSLANTSYGDMLTVLRIRKVLTRGYRAMFLLCNISY
eukprot:3645151-Rhodomonas_salina.3